MLKPKIEHMDENNYIFIHIPKTGGRSVLSALGVKFHCEHKTMQDYIKEITEPVIRSRYKFTIIRNPWDRAVSWYRFFYKPMGKEIPLTFDEWICKNKSGILKNRIDKPSFNRKVPLDQLSYCRNQSGEILIDKFLRFENLTEDFKEVASKLNITSPLPYIGKNEQEHAITMAKHMIKHKKLDESKVVLETSLNYKDLYKSQESIDIITNLNKELIEMFNYTF